MGLKVLQMANHRQPALRLLFWGMMGEFSYLVLQGLLEAGVRPTAVVIPASVTSLERAAILRLDPDPPRSLLPMAVPFLQHSITHLAWQHQIAVYELRRPSDPETAAQLAALEVDVALVACFPWRIPPTLLSLPRHGFLNLHPSLLPDLRGPFPLFWAFRLGMRSTGVTVHHMDSGMDTGPIALQQALALPDGISGPEADQLSAVCGSSLLVRGIDLLQGGELPRIAQTNGGSSYSRPKREDFQIPTSWPARRAYNFIRGTAEWNTPFQIIGPQIDIKVRQAVSFEADVSQEQPFIQDGSEIQVQFSPGVLHAR